MKKHLITRFLILAPLAFLTLQCSKTDNSPAPEPQKLSLSDTVTAKPKLEHQDQKDTAEKIAHYIANEYLTPGDLKAITMSERKFHYQQIDLNGDGKTEVFLSFYTPYFFRTGGCAMLLLNDHLKPITKFTVTRPPVYADSATKNGWKILYLQDGYQWKALHYKNGKNPSNPSVLPKSSEKPSEQATIIFPDNDAKDYTF